MSTWTVVKQIIVSTLIGKKRIWESQKDIKEKEKLFLSSKDQKSIIWKWEHQALQGKSRCYRKRVELCSDVSSDPALRERCLEWDQTFLQSLTEYWINCLTFRGTEQMFISFPLHYSYFFFYHLAFSTVELSKWSLRVALFTLSVIKETYVLVFYFPIHCKSVF